ncbi:MULTISPECIES: hypothetical protein [unclassified Streptomyces]|uniref:hypothetical protein n=1 Tax=unclassified Streptomyces TaxID=2593676 RepID=UPI00224F9E96|nr:MULTISPECIES: hypothetical protein [unclassified Streptomyces]MCX5138820.1 hypothetical protein [Streptomyces sp. NBC_00338]WSU57497.1 hypothetical protein OG450_06345 [Streptomyces sp. NBC_01104]
MRNLKIMLGASVATAGAVATLMTGAGTVNAAAAASLYGCPSGAVCIYAEGKPASSATLTHTFWSYGAHNLSNQKNYHWVINNQTGGASADLCLKYDGGSCTGGRIPAGGWDDPNLTPINSVRLNRP